MKCPKCQTENPEEAVFCIQCGARVTEEIPPTCPSCGTELPAGARFCFKCGHSLIEQAPTTTPTPPSSEPTSFAGGRYQVKQFLGEGGKKKVYLAHDNTLDRDVAFALIKTEKLDDETRTRIQREAQAMGRLGDHPNIVTIHDMGEHEGQPYIVLPVMSGGDVEGLIEKAPEHRLPLEEVIGITRCVCQGLGFAHSKGIIHRDLKPGNVWLSVDGTAKIGDFGLAVAVDLSRLTQSGMMVGTVSYMPPEQAMGGKVTNKADLYSLGAMLYEMVTGRPPFIGDDSVAIIGQHINTSVVSPTWHRADLPPGLEVLILQLLEKDPEKRPASASDVLKALESIEAGKVEKEPSRVTTAPESSPLYRKVFVGREPEQKQLQAAFDGAMSGQGALMMVVGEPGIGKTALCEQIATYVTLRGGKTLVGHCYEEGSLSLPYLAFVEAMRSYVLSRETRDLRKELGTGAADVARIISEIREKLKVEPRPPESPEEERYRLFQAVTSFLTNAAKVQPLLIILEDLHDSDKGTLEMLTHISRNMSGARLLIVGTYRDVEVDRTHPLSAALAELRRVATFDRVLLRGLNADEVRRMLESIVRQDVPWGLAEAVHRQTEGNPLFVQEVVRYIVEEGLISREGGQWRATRDTPLEMSIPEGLRDVVGKRLSGLSQECNRILSIASVIGRDFRLAVLQKVAGVSDDELFAALEEAKGTAVVEERSMVGAAVTYRFTHAFFRQTLYEEIIAPRRIRLHQQVGQALEGVYEKRLEEHAAELAEHFSYSPDAEGLAKAVSYGKMAAERASSVYAYGEAVRLLEQALKVQEVLDSEDKAKQCELLLTLSYTLIYAAESRRALDAELRETFSLAEAIGDENFASQACNLALSALTFWGYATPGVFRSEESIEWANRADHYAREGTKERAIADMFLGMVRYSTGHPRTAFSLYEKSLDLARRLEDNEAYCMVVPMWLAYASQPQNTEQRQKIAEELSQRSRAGVDLRIVGGILHLLGTVYLEYEQRERCEEIWREYQEIAERTGQSNALLMSMQFRAILKTVDGRLDEAVQLADDILVRGIEWDLRRFARTGETFVGTRARILLGMAEILLEAMPPPPFNDYLRSLYLAHLGRHTEAIPFLDEILDGREFIYDGYWANVILLEAATLVGHKGLAEALLDELAGRTPSMTSYFYNTCVPRHLGTAAALLDRLEEARNHYQEAIRACTGVRHRPELALTRLQLAELLLEHYPNEKSDALEHLDFAINEFREMKMQPSLERALRHKEILGA
ncbi:MAG: protein kinase [Dehalococcoidales bacterium]|nr:MAG: protein kinase [Dehalococcoidales bacterium]